ncbi:MAG: enoyl-CoA hydratase/isomerase family protein [Hellea sp.]|nr:enoyl-CoA hydratase/isomerase family protein [Hellea sp.]
MKNALTFAETGALQASCLPLEAFGPQTNHPFLAFDLSGSNGSLNNWLSRLPCPVIGIGDGLAASACDVVLETDKKLDIITNNIEAAPITAMTLVQHLRAIEGLPMDKALTMESLAYGTVQQGPEFMAWLKSYEGGRLIAEPGPPIISDIDGDTLHIRINRPKNYNAIGTEVRDALCEILDMALINDGIQRVELTGNGKTFSIGGAIQEFGEVTDPATAHWIRSIRLPATRLAQLSDRLHIHVNGAAIGAGAEICGFAKQVTASEKAWFQLPELKYGLIPGAGGTVALSHRIGRQRTGYMALSMEKVSVKTAMDWGLVDEVVYV